MEVQQLQGLYDKRVLITSREPDIIRVPYLNRNKVKRFLKINRKRLNIKCIVNRI